MNILAIETATDSLGICLKTANKLLNVVLKVGYKHGETLVPWIKELCRTAGITPQELNLVVASLGPGSFTGLRIGLATAKGLAMGANCPIVGVPTLDTMAWGVHFFKGLVIPLIDAKKNRYYGGFYEQAEKKSDYLDLSLPELVEKLPADQPILLTGPAGGDLFPKIQEQSPSLAGNLSLDPNFTLINPYPLLEKGLLIFKEKGGADNTLHPIYLRKSEAELSLDEKKGAIPHSRT